MSLPVFIASDIPETGQNVMLSGSEGKHAVSVKRIQPGEFIELIDGYGVRARSQVLSTSGKDQLVAQVIEQHQEPVPTPRVSIIQALPKSERSELAVDLMTQAGVDEIIPWAAERCIAQWVGNKAIKGRMKWENAAISAAKQSRRVRVPIIAELATTAEVENRITQADLAVVLHENARVSLKELDFQVKDIVLIIGPEGGISDKELARFSAVGAHAVHLGKEVVRTASAGMVALSALGVLTSRW
ncbi:16S ribosomal RNA methyltransferase RsmE [Corynebacterium kutscheri]|uniref:Ribosomal RNA small subunit methyltransferase E n=1 Tax=Corynebacterium kutscheri TaxID=35755 RepID=A0A0F6TD54_9CORY|nr:16S rRNA (uracil(1498)-N(3))-methyltransferase [Corynebacterium kutscheri]AKE40946.1 RNA methyltransferase, RsmE family [Corynebacterium kutscheri]VEH06781.1 16S ribosomal RNA methyltransferase RsmE [Corynebacterium kutscheri]VEH09245.1 16S ribosomal RNA methyltransferase RsmE [Corynebacterium kutscheri]VEH79332.1 16S ribosomal RNA methyltransferase RsmE [Corynebacterium kutscheri]